MVAELNGIIISKLFCCSLAKISMVAEPSDEYKFLEDCCSLAKISMVAEPLPFNQSQVYSCSLAKISMVAELENT